MTTSWKWTPNKSDIALHRKIVEQSLKDGAEFLLEDANRRVPIGIGTMKRSGTVTADGLKAAVAYDTPYAPRQHEATHYRHTYGEAKWLQRTFGQKRDRVGRLIADRIKAATS